MSEANMQDLKEIAVTTGAVVLEEKTVVARRRTERGMVSAEWAVGLIAAVAVAGVLLTVVTDGPVRQALLNIVLTIIDTFSKNAGKF